MRDASDSARTGYTTGTCAALAAGSAARMLLTGEAEATATLVTPTGVAVTAALHHARIAAGEAECAVRKDAGDDPDVTDGMMIHVRVHRTDERGTIHIDGGEGVGRVTRPGMDQPVGAAAINSVPRKMIEGEVRSVWEEYGYQGGMDIVVAIPGGESVAAKTFNPRLGILGGLSVIGTTGIVEPMSHRAVVATIRTELGVLHAEGWKGVILTPGNYGGRFLDATPSIALRPQVKCSNHMGEAIDAAAGMGFTEILVVGHIGKLIKLAGGIMNTHSRMADCRMDLLALHAALAGAETPLLHRVMDAVTVDEGLDMLEPLRKPIVASLMKRSEAHLARRAGEETAVGVVLFTNRSGLLGISKRAGALLSRWEKPGE